MIKKAILIVSAVSVLFLLVFINLPTSGKQILKNVPVDDANKIVICKTIDNGNGVFIVSECTIPREEIPNLVQHFSDTILYYIKENPFPIESEVRYDVHIVNNKNTVKADLKFYDDDALVIDCAYGDKPAFHRRYLIEKTKLIEFFENMLNSSG